MSILSMKNTNNEIACTRLSWPMNRINVIQVLLIGNRCNRVHYLILDPIFEFEAFLFILNRTMAVCNASHHYFASPVHSSKNATNSSTVATARGCKQEKHNKANNAEEDQQNNECGRKVRCVGQVSGASKRRR